MLRLITLTLLLITLLPAQVNQVKAFIPHVIDGGGWVTRIEIQNPNSIPIGVGMKFYDRNGKSMNFYDNSTPPRPNWGSTLLCPFCRTTFETSGLPLDVADGSAEFTTWYANANSSGPPPSVAVTARFRMQLQNGPWLEATVPGQLRPAKALMVPFDTRAGRATGMAVANNTSSAFTVSIVVYDSENYFPIGSHQYATRLTVTNMTFAAKEKKLFNLVEQFPSLVNKIGVITFEPLYASGSALSAVAIQFNEKGSFTTVFPLD